MNTDRLEKLEYDIRMIRAGMGFLYEAIEGMKQMIEGIRNNPLLPPDIKKAIESDYILLFNTTNAKYVELKRKYPEMPDMDFGRRP